MLERHLDEHRTASRDLGVVWLGPHPFGRPQPRQLTTLVSRVQLGKFLHGGVRHVQDVVVGGGREPAPGSGQVFQHHHELPVRRLIRAVPNARRPHGQLAADVGVHTRLGHAQADLPDQLSLILRKRLQLDEQRLGYRAPRSEPDPRPAGGARVGVYHLNRADIAVQRLAEPPRRQVTELGGYRDAIG